MIRFVDGGITPVATHKTADGYLVGTFRCARPGIQLYRRKEIGLTDGDAMGVVRVYRPPEVVFDTESLKTYAGKPITIEHPKGGVSADSWKQLAVGSVGSRVMRDGEAVVVEGVIMDAAAIELVESGKRQVSMGYTTPIEMRDGVTPEGEVFDAVQVGPIKINHLAMVDTARGGDSLRFGDSAGDPWGATPVNDGAKDMTMKPVVLGDAAVTLPLADAALVEAFKATMTKRLDDAKAEIEEEKEKAKKLAAEKDEAIGELKVKSKALEDAAMTPAQLSALVDSRVALERQVSLVDSGIEVKGIADADLRRAAVAKRLGDAVVQDASDAEISGMFKAVVAALGDADPFREVMKGQPLMQQDSGDSWAQAAQHAGVSFKKGA